MPTDPNKARYYRKQVPLFRLVEKLKLWPSRRGILHGIKEFEERGAYAVVITHCGKHMVAKGNKTVPYFLAHFNGLCISLFFEVEERIRITEHIVCFPVDSACDLRVTERSVTNVAQERIAGGDCFCCEGRIRMCESAFEPYPGEQAIDARIGDLHNNPRKIKYNDGATEI